MEKSDLRIEMLGTSFSIAADEDPLYLDNLLKRFQVVVENTRKTTGLQDPLKIAILTGFLLCDEIEKMKGLVPEENESREAEKITLDLIARIDDALQGADGNGNLQT